MEDYEVSLKDYINVIKKEKFLILTVFLVAVISAGVFSFSQPDEYEVTATLHIKDFSTLRTNDLPFESDFKNEYKSVDIATSFLSSEDISRLTVSAAELHKIEPFASSPNPTDAAVNWLGKNIEVEDKKGIITLRIRGTLEPGVLKSILDAYIEVFIRESDSLLAENVQSELQKIKEKEERIEAQKVEIVKSMSEIDIENISESEAKLMKYSSLTSQFTTIERQLTDIHLYEVDMEYVVSSHYEWIEIISPPFEPNVPVGPKRLLNIVIAGVLGLFIGVFAAFFKNYMETE
jgi:uncharacterized protein involved in exopolysaccharide biosynthesis